jgi:hypothetical protein
MLLHAFCARHVGMQLVLLPTVGLLSIELQFMMAHLNACLPDMCKPEALRLRGY